VVVLTLSLTIMRGGAGSQPVPTAVWGGLPLTLLMSLIAAAGAFPLAIALALGRRSTLGFVRLFSITFIEVIRGVPLIAVLYVAALLVPLMLPAGLTIDQLLRAQLGITIFVSAYMAEVVRSGLQSIPSGQYEAARALGLGSWAATRLVILPQALRAVIPSFVTLALGVLQDTTLVVVIGIFDFLNAARAAANDPNWLGFYDEAFGFAAAVYFVLCFAGSRYSLWLERHLRQE
jgi:general L-amino acid transport system permease protein